MQNSARGGIFSCAILFILHLRRHFSKFAQRISRVFFVRSSRLLFASVVRAQARRSPVRSLLFSEVVSWIFGLCVPFFVPPAGFQWPWRRGGLIFRCSSCFQATRVVKGFSHEISIFHTPILKENSKFRDRNFVRARFSSCFMAYLCFSIGVLFLRSILFFFSF
jgi:hypothetical protein